MDSLRTQDDAGLDVADYRDGGRLAKRLLRVVFGATLAAVDLTLVVSAYLLASWARFIVPDAEAHPELVAEHGRRDTHANDPGRVDQPRRLLTLPREVAVGYASLTWRRSPRA